jgi:hypothetical protein
MRPLPLVSGGSGTPPDRDLAERSDIYQDPPTETKTALTSENKPATRYFGDYDKGRYIEQRLRGRLRLPGLKLAPPTRQAPSTMSWDSRFRP